MKWFRLSVAFGFLSAATLSAKSAGANVKLPAVLSSHMVLQRDMPVPIWGKADPRENITVKFRAQTKTTAADNSGNWRLDLDPLTAGGPDTLTIVGKDTLTLEDVLVGEVWLGSGQSNMSHTTETCLSDADQINQPRDADLVRDSAKSWPRIRLLTSGSTSWQASTPDTNPKFSGLLLEFGIQLQSELKVPVGLMVGAIGGTASRFWIPRDAFDQDPSIQKAVAVYAPKLEAERKIAQEQLDKWKHSPAANAPNAAPPVRVPVSPSEDSGIGQNYRRLIRPLVPFAIRGVLWDQGESETRIGGVDQYTMMGPLISGWRKDWGQGEFPWVYMEKPGGWGCALNPADPVTVRARPFEPLPAKFPEPYADGRRRFMYTRIREYPNTAMACTSDLGIGLHPLDKSAYATRAVRAALSLAYQSPAEIYGPTFKSMAADGPAIRIQYSHLGKGLTVPPGKPLQGFAIAGEDKVWFWAEAKLDGNTVLVSNPKVPKPVAVRYAWAERIPWATLFSQEGLPALPFQTADW